MRLQDGTVRKLRQTFNLEGHAHELTFSCHLRLPLLNRDRTRQWFVEALAKARARYRFELWAYVIMPEHAHVRLFPTAENYSIPSILKAIKQPVARRATNYLRIHAPDFLQKLKVIRPGGRVEYRFWTQGGGYDRNIFEPKIVLASIEYLHNNPVRRGLSSTPDEWRWSSAAWYAGMPAKLEIDAVLTES